MEQEEFARFTCVCIVITEDYKKQCTTETRAFYLRIFLKLLLLWDFDSRIPLLGPSVVFGLFWYRVQDGYIKPDNCFS